MQMGAVSVKSLDCVVTAYFGLAGTMLGLVQVVVRGKCSVTGPKHMDIHMEQKELQMRHQERRTSQTS